VFIERKQSVRPPVDATTRAGHEADAPRGRAHAPPHRATGRRPRGRPLQAS